VSQHVPRSGNESNATRARTSSKRVALATLLCLIGFVGFWAGAMAFYPGGTWLDPSQQGQSFFANFFCDLAQPVSLSGVANPVGSRLAQSGMLLFAAALGGFFWVVPEHFARDSGCRSWVRRAGGLSVLVFAFVSVMPSEHFGRLHAALALVSGGLGLFATFLAVWALFASGGRSRALALLGGLALAVGGFDAVLFIEHLGDSAPPPLLVPAAQKIAALILSAWLASVASLTLLDDNSRRA
jgi:hypothetical protein